LILISKDSITGSFKKNINNKLKSKDKNTNKIKKIRMKIMQIKKLESIIITNFMKQKIITHFMLIKKVTLSIKLLIDHRKYRKI
jgi:hypothetical protein